MDERRLKSVASDISRRYGSDTTEMEKLAMEWAIQEFHRWLVSERFKRRHREEHAMNRLPAFSA